MEVKKEINQIICDNCKDEVGSVKCELCKCDLCDYCIEQDYSITDTMLCEQCTTLFWKKLPWFLKKLQEENFGNKH